MRLVADIGGTNMRIAVGDTNGTILRMEKHDTPSVYAHGIDVLVKTMEELRADAEVDSVVIGVAGVKSEDGRSLSWSPHLAGWVGRDLAGDLEAALALPVALQNDAALGALGEALLGAGAGAPIVAYLAVGTGIGGGRIVDGTLDRSSFGFEVGHQYLSPGGEFEELVSGSAIERLEGVSALAFEDRARWRDYAHQFAVGLYNTLLHWSPDRVVLGGSLMADDGLHIEEIMEGLHAVNRAIPQLPEIRKAALEYPGLVGALVYSGTR